jgi:hypothetical protein
MHLPVRGIRRGNRPPCLRERRPIWLALRPGAKPACCQDPARTIPIDLNLPIPVTARADDHPLDFVGSDVGCIAGKAHAADTSSAEALIAMQHRLAAAWADSIVNALTRCHRPEPANRGQTDQFHIADTARTSAIWPRWYAAAIPLQVGPRTHSHSIRILRLVALARRSVCGQIEPEDHGCC